MATIYDKGFDVILKGKDKITIEGLRPESFCIYENQIIGTLFLYYKSNTQLIKIGFFLQKYSFSDVSMDSHVYPINCREAIELLEHYLK